MGKSTGMGFDDFGRLSDMNDDGVTMAMADPLSFVGPSATPEQRVDLAIDAGARKQGGSYDPNTRTVTMPDKSGQRKPQGGAVAGGSNVVIPSDPSMRVNAGGGEGMAGPVRLEGNITIPRYTGQVEDRVTGARTTEESWNEQHTGIGKDNHWPTGGKDFKRREDAAVGVAAEALGETPIERQRYGGDYEASPQKGLARRIMTSPDREFERVGANTNPFMSEDMSDEQLLEMATNGSVLHPASDVVSMGTNWTKPTAEQLAGVSKFEQTHGTLPEGIPFDRDKQGGSHLVQRVMPELNHPANPNKGGGGKLTPGVKKIKPRKK